MKRAVSRFLLSVLVLGSLGVCVGACGGGDDDEEGTDSTDGTEGTDGTDGTDGTSGTESTEPPPPACDDTSDENFVALFGYRGLIPGVNSDEYDIYMMRPIQKFEPVPLTEFSLKEEGKTCEFGCLVDEKLEWIAVNGSPPDADGFDFQMGKFNECLGVSLVKGGELQDNAHFEFAKNFIYYSKKVTETCTGPSCQYAIHRLDLSNLASAPEKIIPFFPQGHDPDWINGHSTYKGRFRVSPDGNAVIILSPTIRSQKVFIWTAGTLHEVDYLCENFQNDNCIGAGSAYSDNDPLAISPDSSTVLLFSITDRALRVRRYSTVNPAEMGSSPILAVPATSAAYHEVACAERLNKPWAPVDVVGQPVYTPDGKWVLFVGHSKCDPDLDKAETDIFKMDPSWIGDLTPVEENELINLTKNVAGDIPDNNEITSLALSPDGKRVLYTATPELDSNWKPMKVTDKSQFNDNEVFMVSVCGGAGQQLTRSVSKRASSPRALPIPDLTACPSSPLAAPGG